MPRVESALHTATESEIECCCSCTDTHLRSQYSTHILFACNKQSLLQQHSCSSTTDVVTGSVVGSRDAQNVGRVVAKDGGQEEPAL